MSFVFNKLEKVLSCLRCLPELPKTGKIIRKRRSSFYQSSETNGGTVVTLYLDFLCAYFFGVLATFITTQAKII